MRKSLKQFLKILKLSLLSFTKYYYKKKVLKAPIVVACSIDSVKQSKFALY